MIPALVVLALLVSGCTSFRGPGRFQTGSDYTGGGEDVGVLAPVEAARPAGALPLQWPVARVKLNRGFRPASDPKHQGVDLGGELGTPILAAHSGAVVYAGNQFRGYGNMIILEYDGGWATLYGHLSRLRATEGLRVNKGDLLGLMGRSGHATGVHLHFELLRERQPIDPVPYLPAALRGLATAR